MHITVNRKDIFCTDLNIFDINNRIIYIFCIDAIAQEYEHQEYSLY